MTDKQTPPDWVLIEAAERWDSKHPMPALAADLYRNNEGFRALCDMIEKHEQPPVDRKLLCARKAVRDRGWAGQHQIAVRAIELWESGYGS